MKRLTESSRYLSNDEHKEIVDIKNKKNIGFTFISFMRCFLFHLSFHIVLPGIKITGPFI